MLSQKTLEEIEMIKTVSILVATCTTACSVGEVKVDQVRILSSGGGWAGGGGLIRRDSNNPWWVKNTTEVRFCIDIDEPNFGISAQKALELTQGSINWWKKSFQDSLDGGVTEVGVGQQRFVFEPSCSSSTDLRVQFGVLSPEQKAQWDKNVLEAPQQYRGIALRTSYDTVSMRGKGFIYLSPQAGDYKMTGNQGDIANPWSYANGRLVGHLLVHELGHVFGYDHGTIELMNPSFMDMMFQKEFSEQIAMDPEDFFIPNPFRFTEGSRTECFEAGKYPQAREYWNLPSGDACIKLDVQFSPHKEQRVIASRGTSERGPWQIVAQSESFVASTTINLSSFLYLPREQSVFQDDSSSVFRALPGVRNDVKTVWLQTPDGNPFRTIKLNLKAGEANFEASASLHDELFDPLRPMLVSE